MDTLSERFALLTLREREVLELIAAGLSNRAIAEHLVLSQHTVAWYVKQIFSKLDVNRRTEAVAVARSLGLLNGTGPSRESPKPDKPATSQHNLPLQPTSFIGREREIAQIVQLLDDANCRLLTLVGPGGIGKTFLALELGSRHVTPEASRRFFEDGVYFIALQPLTSHEDIVRTIANTLGHPLQSNGRDPQQQLLDYFREKSILLLMDNFEHLLDGVQIVSDLLVAAPNVCVLATSRESLNLREEHLYNVEGLEFPNHNQTASINGYSAIELFAERARQVYPNFSLVDQLPYVVQICQLVNGMPLALELAASWLKTLSCAEIAAEIERGLEFLVTPLRNIPERHRSMETVFDYSWQLLSEAERATFQRLSVFRGGCSHKAAQVVTGADRKVLQGLADKSFIRRNTCSGRYDIHELLRQYGEAQLKQSADDLFTAHDNHCVYYTDLLGQYRDDVSNHRQQHMLQVLEPDLDNIRAAWRWAVDHTKIDEIQNALHTFAYFHVFRSRFLEEAHALEAAIHSLDCDEPVGRQGVVLAALLSYCGCIYIRIGKYQQAEAVFQRSGELYHKLDAPAVPGWGSEPFATLTLLASIQGDYEQGEKYGKKARAISETHGDKWNLQLALYGSTSVCFHQGKYEDARRYAEQAYAISKESGDQWFRAIVLNDLGSIARVMSDYPQAREHFQTSFAIRRTFDDSQGMAAALNHLGVIAELEGDYVEAQRLYRESHALYKKIGDRGGVGYALCRLGTTAFASVDYQAAGQHLSAALQIANDIQYAPFTFSVLNGVSELLLHTGQHERGIELLALILHYERSDHEAKKRARHTLAHWGDDVKAQLGDKSYAAAWERGKALDLETIIKELLDEL